MTSSNIPDTVTLHVNSASVEKPQPDLGFRGTVCEPPLVSFNTNYSLTLMDLPTARFENDFQHYASENGHACEFETAFCRDFSCCGLRLVDMHDLLQHYEECHVRFEDDGDDMFDRDSEFFDDDCYSDSDSATLCPSPFPRSPPSSFQAKETGTIPASITFASATAATAAAASHIDTTNQSLSLLQSLHSSHPATRSRPFSPFLLPPFNNPPNGDSSCGDHVLPLTFANSIHPSSLDAFSVAFRASSKRKAAALTCSQKSQLSARDEDERVDVDDSELSDSATAYPNMTLRSRTVSSASTSSLSSTSTVQSSRSTGSRTKRLTFGHDGNRGPLSAAVKNGINLGPCSNTSQALQQPSDLCLGRKRPKTVAGSFANRNVAERSRGSHLAHADQTPLDITMDSGNMFNVGNLGNQCRLFVNTACTMDAGIPGPKIPYDGEEADLIRHREEIVSMLVDLGKTNGLSGDKPYRCAVSGCDKAYKNPNGLKYHNMHGHCSVSDVSEADSPETKPIVCTFLECGRRYKNLNGLKYHVEHSHPNMIGALRAHHCGLTSNHAFLLGPFSSHAAMAIDAALNAIESSPMMMAAANAILATQSVNRVWGNGNPSQSNEAEAHTPSSSTPTTRQSSPGAQRQELTTENSAPFGPEIREALQALMAMGQQTAAACVGLSSQASLFPSLGTRDARQT